MTHRPSPERGRFIVLEGLDGSGTSTQARDIAAALGESGREVWLTAEPTTGEIGRLLRRYLGGELPLPAGSAGRELMALLFAADRREHLSAPDEGIEARLARGEDVVCGRYVLSSLAYEGEEAAEYQRVQDLNRDFLRPDLTVYLDCPVAVSLERLRRTRDDLEIFENEAKLERVREGYRRALGDEVGPVLILDATRPAADLTREALEVLALGAAQS
jgi:dTMP kinase